MKTIIIVEDDIAILEPMAIVLEMAGYSVIALSDGARVVNNDFSPPDLFLIDNQLGGLQGSDICRYLKNQEITKHIPVVLVSANPAIKKIATEVNAEGYLEKPFTMDELRNIVAKHING